MLIVLTLAIALAARGYPRAAAFDVLMAALTLGVVRLLRTSFDARFGMKLGIAALTLHWVIVAGIQIVLAVRGHPPLVLPDEFAYDQFAKELSSAWLGTGPAVPANDAYISTPFSVVLAGTYVVGGASPFAGLALPVAFGTWIPVLVHRIVAAIVNSGSGSILIARAAGVVALVYPTTLGWSCLLLKDSSVTFAATAVLGLILALKRPPETARAWMLWALSLAAAVAWLYGVRPPQLIPFAGGLAVVAIWLIVRGRTATRLVVAAVTVGVVASIALIPALASRVDRLPKTLATHRVVSRQGGQTAEPPESNPQSATWASTAAHVPEGLVLVFLRPYPSEVRNSAELVGALGNIVYLLLCTLAAGGFVVAWRMGARPEMLFFAGTAVAMWLLLALAEGDAGTAWRHRDAITPLLAGLVGFAVAQPALHGRLTRLSSALGGESSVR